MRIKELVKYGLGFLKAKLNHVEFGKHCYIGLDVKICSLGGVKLLDNVIIRPSCSVYTSSSKSRLLIGKNTEIGNHSTISAYREIIIGDGVLTGPHVYIADHNHNYLNPNVHIYKQGVLAEENSRVIIGEGTWLGTNVVIVGSVKIGKQCVVGANTVVTKDIPDYSVAVGIPARVIKRYDFEKKKWVKIKET